MHAAVWILFQEISDVSRNYLLILTVLLGRSTVSTVTCEFRIRVSQKSARYYVFHPIQLLVHCSVRVLVASTGLPAGRRVTWRRTGPAHAGGGKLRKFPARHNNI